MVRIRRTGGVVIVCIALTILASGCDWSMYRGGPARTGFNSGESGDGAISTTNASSLHALPSVTIPGINPANGQSSPVSGDGHLWVNGNDGNVHVLDKDGHQVASLHQNGMTAMTETPGAPTVAHGSVYVVDRFRLYGWDTKTLAPLSWSPRALPGNSIVSYVPLVLASPVYVSERDSLVVPSGTAEITEFSASDGHILNDYNASDYLTSPLAVAGHWVFFGTNNGKVGARDLTKQGTNWTVSGTIDSGKKCVVTQGASVGLVAAVVPVGDKLIVDRCGDRIVARSITTGKLLWKAQNAGKALQPLGVPAVAYGKVYIQTTDGFLHAVDLASGADLGSVNLFKGGASVSVANGLLFTAPAMFVLDANTLAIRYGGAPILYYNESVGAVAESTVENGRVVGLSGGQFVGWGL